MTLNDPLANTLSAMENAEKVGKKSCTISPNSKIMGKVLDILKENEYIKGYTVHKNGRSTFMQVELSGMINKCGAIKPRFSVASTDYERFEKRYLPARDMGVIVVSTSHGLMVHTQAKQKNIGGRLIAYCY